MTWFKSLTGCVEDSPESVRQHLIIDGQWLRSRLNGRSWLFGELETPSLGQLRERVGSVKRAVRPLSVREIVANVQHLHRERANENALFQVASQFNLLEMASPGVIPERGVGIYEYDHTQGPACAIAAGAGTIFRNYFLDVNGQIGQTANNQMDCLSGIGLLLDNSRQRLWQMVNGYALPSASGLEEINRKLKDMGEAELDSVRQALQIGLHWDTQVTLDDASHTVSQAYCSAMPLAYTSHPQELWAPFAKLVLEAAYEAALCAAILNADRGSSRKLFLTLLGGGAFGNNPDWITGAIRRSLELYSDSGLDIAIVSYGTSNHSVRQLLHEFAQPNRDGAIG
ncbi:MAG TPA: hypothetical protein DCY89_08395 [Gammaproteobacteria bacterium]|nr:hypothetical protein [Gammaproteobacteria bacterium]